jgi:transposase-like protein
LLREGRTPGELSKSLRVSPETLRNWRRQDQLDRHERDDGVTSDERAELARLRRAYGCRRTAGCLPPCPERPWLAPRAVLLLGAGSDSLG